LLSRSKNDTIHNNTTEDKKTKSKDNYEIKIEKKNRGKNRSHKIAYKSLYQFMNFILTKKHKKLKY